MYAAHVPILACLDSPMPTDGTCAVQAWVEPLSTVPTLTVGDAQTIAVALLGALVAVMVVKIVAKKSQ